VKLVKSVEEIIQIKLTAEETRAAKSRSVKELVGVLGI